MENPALGPVERQPSSPEGVADGVSAGVAPRSSQVPQPLEVEKELREWNRTWRGYDLGKPLDYWVREQGVRTPEAVAVRFEGEEWTYGELLRRSGKLAGYLRGLGAGPNELVAVYMERSLEMVAALLGVMEAGAAYVPVDPEYPAERVAFMLEDAGARIVLTQGRLAGRAPAGSAEVVKVDLEWGRIEAAGECAGVERSGEDLAYMIYTSGSTGRPKGAKNRHRGIVNRLLWMQEEFGLRAEDRVLQKTPFSFDVSVWEFFWPLMTGARLVLVKPGGHRDAEHLCEVIEREGITVLHFVPSMLAAFLEEPGVARCGTVRDVICSGEALGHPLQERFFGRMKAGLHNLYGPTEAAVDVTCWHCERGSARTTVPIGRPVANTQCYVLDERMEPAPPGAAGELYLGGVQVGAGYHRRPELTAERFVPDRFGEGAGGEGRLYRTGDLVRRLPGGELEYLGRLDFQVKIRGFRIELGEIEAALARHPAVSEAVVTTVEARPGDARLAAYVVCRKGCRTTPSELKAHLLPSLPDYMIPASFSLLEAMPLNATGKADRRALAAVPAAVEPERRERPANGLEANLVKVWQELLGRSPVGVTENFFDAGGHSLLALKLAAAIQRELGYPVKVHDIFAAQTVRALAATLKDRKPSDDSAAGLVALQTDGPGAPLFFVYQGLALYDLAQHFRGRRPCYGVVNGLVLRGPDASGAPPAPLTVESIAANFIEALLRKPLREPVWLAGYSFSGVVAFEMSRQLSDRGVRVAPLIIIDSNPVAFPEPGLRVIQWKLMRAAEELRRDPRIFLKSLKAAVREARMRTVARRGARRAELEAFGEEAMRIYMEARFIQVASRVWPLYTPRKAPGGALVIRFSDTFRRQRFVSRRVDPSLGWQAYFSEPVETAEVRGDHSAFLKGLGFKEVAGLMASFAERWDQSHAGGPPGASSPA